MSTLVKAAIHPTDITTVDVLFIICFEVTSDFIYGNEKIALLWNLWITHWTSRPWAAVRDLKNKTKNSFPYNILKSDRVILANVL